VGSLSLLVTSGAFIPLIEFFGIRKESKSARIKEWSGMFSLICLINFKAAVGAKILLSNDFDRSKY
jgi:hypothetical protein